MGKFGFHISPTSYVGQKDKVITNRPLQEI